MHQDYKKRLIALLLKKSFKYSEEPTFKLASGKMSNYYIDCRKVTHHPEGKFLIGNIIYNMIKDLPIQSVGGLTMGADPIACSVSYAAYSDKHNIASFSIRKEPKGHGLGKQVEGDVQAGDSVIILEDVITTGGSTIKAIEAAEREGLKVAGVIALVDRQEGGGEEVLKHVSDLQVVCTREELVEAYKQQ